MADLHIRAGGMDRDEVHTLKVLPFLTSEHEPPINHELQAKYLAEFLEGFVPLETLRQLAPILAKW